MPNSPEKPDHLIFLDIDGVLRPDRAYDGKLKKKPIKHVKKIASALNSRIVITSIAGRCSINPIFSMG